MSLDALSSCAELTTELAEDAARSSTSMRTLLTWASEVARPGEGGPKVLMAIARLAHAVWIEGTPYVELRGDALSTTISVFADLGTGIHERVFPLARLRVPIGEFSRALRLAPQLAAPFRTSQRGDALVLRLPGAGEPSAVTESQQSITIDERSLRENERPTTPPPGPTKEADETPTKPPPTPVQSALHTHPTVRRMVAVRPEALRRGNDEED